MRVMKKRVLDSLGTETGAHLGWCKLYLGDGMKILLFA